MITPCFLSYSEDEEMNAKLDMQHITFSFQTFQSFSKKKISRLKKLSCMLSAKNTKSLFFTRLRGICQNKTIQYMTNISQYIHEYLFEIYTTTYIDIYIHIYKYIYTYTYIDISFQPTPTGTRQYMQCLPASLPSIAVICINIDIYLYRYP